MMFVFDYKYYKWAAIFPGWILGDYVGAIASFFLVSELMSNKENEISFELALLKLSSQLIKSDGIVEDSEVKLVQSYFLNNFGSTKSKKLFQEIKSRKDIPSDVNTLTNIIKSKLNPSKYYSIIQFLYGLSAVDGKISIYEDEFIFNVGLIFGFSNERLDSIKHQFIKNEPTKNTTQYSKEVIEALYVLGLEGGVTMDEIKKAYRGLAKEFHPDKVSGMSEGIIKLAKEKFQLIQNSYEYLTKHYV